MRHIRLLIFASNAIFPTIFNVKSAAQPTGMSVELPESQHPLESVYWRSTGQGKGLYEVHSLTSAVNKKTICNALALTAHFNFTGVGGVGQNKGGIAVSFSVWDTEFCFVNSHLAAHQDKVNSRNAMYRSIVRGIRLDPYNMDILTGHHHVFWMGDLNYRIAFGQQRSSPTDEEFAAVVGSPPGT